MFWRRGGSQSARTPVKPIYFGLSFFERKDNNRDKQNAAHTLSWLRAFNEVLRVNEASGYFYY